jgi:hypothetical protein
MILGQKFILLRLAGGSRSDPSDEESCGILSTLTGDLSKAACVSSFISGERKGVAKGI